jgi:hypothetical protein
VINGDKWLFVCFLWLFCSAVCVMMAMMMREYRGQEREVWGLFILDIWLLVAALDGSLELWCM